MIVRSTVDLGHNLGLDVVAEGVEDEATWNALRNFGCDYAQGYWMSRPVPADEIVAFDRERWPRMQALAADAEVQLAR
jgi:EAL domain-containing protein (putative c-di-GMP-specific phosphodiesterase class I)